VQIRVAHVAPARVLQVHHVALVETHVLVLDAALAREAAQLVAQALIAAQHLVVQVRHVAHLHHAVQAALRKAVRHVAQVLHHAVLRRVAQALQHAGHLLDVALDPAVAAADVAPALRADAHVAHQVHHHAAGPVVRPAARAVLRAGRYSSRSVRPPSNVLVKAKSFLSISATLVKSGQMKMFRT
jgi:hypothetical protein